uniref:Uncharacterized protein n=1 Tax=Steinernema glaseri TaxID=37863 RepID=A0A1I7Z3X8_9BILA
MTAFNIHCELRSRLYHFITSSLSSTPELFGRFGSEATAEGSCEKTAVAMMKRRKTTAKRRILTVDGRVALRLYVLSSDVRCLAVNPRPPDLMNNTVENYGCEIRIRLHCCDGNHRRSCEYRGVTERVRE